MDLPGSQAYIVSGVDNRVEPTLAFIWFAAVRQRPHVSHADWITKTRIENQLQFIPDPMASVRNGNKFEVLFETNDGACVLLSQSGESISASIACNDFKQCRLEVTYNWLRSLFPRYLRERADELLVTFWSRGQLYRRSVDAPSWRSIRLNYPDAIQKQLDGVMTSFRPTHGGQLMLWHGRPGTGKTHALGALARSWRNWCSLDYITDPEQFFGDASYMMETLLSPNGPGEGKGWRLFVLEDAGELMAVSARSTSGQGLSRLLNLTDGLIGRGLRVLTLITTNEEVGRLDPAVSRPGRCASLVEFKTFTTEEARAWVQRRNAPVVVDSSKTLAELFAVSQGLPGQSVSRVGARFGL